LIYEPVPATTLKLLYGEAFRAPNAYELYYSYPGLAKANPDLQPETIRTYELVWEQRLPWELRLRTAGYYYEVDDLASQVIDPNDNLTVFRNLENVKARGLEVELEKRTASGLLARLGYAVQRTEAEDTGSELSNSPEHSAKLSLIAPLYPEKLFLGLDLQYYSDVMTVMGGESDDVFLANVTLFSRPLHENLEVSATIYNLFDEQSGFSASTEHLQETIPLPGRSFRVKLTWRF
jgi:iron complex outermembrane receptor protein